MHLSSDVSAQVRRLAALLPATDGGRRDRFHEVSTAVVTFCQWHSVSLVHPEEKTNRACLVLETRPVSGGPPTREPRFYWRGVAGAASGSGGDNAENCCQMTLPPCDVAANERLPVVPNITGRLDA
jgi:hypothetical protein